MPSLGDIKGYGSHLDNRFLKKGKRLFLARDIKEFGVHYLATAILARSVFISQVIAVRKQKPIKIIIKNFKTCTLNFTL